MKKIDKPWKRIACNLRVLVLFCVFVVHLNDNLHARTLLTFHFSSWKYIPVVAKYASIVKHWTLENNNKVIKSIICPTQYGHKQNTLARKNVIGYFFTSSLYNILWLRVVILAIIWYIVMFISNFICWNGSSNRSFSHL